MLQKAHRHSTWSRNAKNEICIDFTDRILVQKKCAVNSAQYSTQSGKTRANCCIEDRSFSTISQDNGGPSFSPFSHDTCALSITQRFYLFLEGGTPTFYNIYKNSLCILEWIHWSILAILSRLDCSYNLNSQNSQVKAAYPLLNYNIRDYYPLWFLFPLFSTRARLDCCRSKNQNSFTEPARDLCRILLHTKKLGVSFLPQISSLKGLKKMKIIHWCYFKKYKDKTISFATTFVFPVGFYTDKGGFHFQRICLSLFPVGDLLFWT